MKNTTRVNFALCWHMHQPWYQQGIDGEYQLPWVYLHAIKDYADMVAHLEAHPKMKVVVNFAPVLLEQLDDYARQLKNWLDHGQKMQDPHAEPARWCDRDTGQHARTLSLAV